MKNFHKRHSANQTDQSQTDQSLFSFMDGDSTERSPLRKLRARHGFGVQLGAMTSLLALAACGSSSSTGSASGDGGGAPSGATRPVVEMPVDAQSASIGDSVSIDVDDIFSSPNGDALVYTVANVPDWLRYDPATNSLIGSPNAEDVAQDASFTVTITAMNTLGESVDTNVEFTLIPATETDPDNAGNRLPTRNMDVPVASEIIVTQGDDEAVVELANSFEDPDADAEITYSVALVDANGEETTDLPEWLIFDAAAGTVTVDPAYQAPAGQAGGEHSDKTPPGIYILRVYALDGDKLDANGDPVKSAPITITLEVRPDLATVTPSDGNEGNTAPAIAADIAMPDAIEVTEDLAFSYTLPSGLFTDADDDTLTYYAYLDDEGTDAPLPIWMSFSSSSGTLTGKPTLDEQAGTYVIHLYAVDGNGGVSPAYAMTVNVTAANDAPIAGDLVNQESGSSDGLSSYDIAGHFTDEEGDSLTYSYAVADADGNDITSTATWLTMEGSVISVDPAAAGEAYGVYTILVSASDGTHMSSAAQFTWELVEEFEGLSFASETETLSAAENQTDIGAIVLARGDVATEDSRVYSLVDGGDSDLIRIDPDTGVLSFLTAPDFEKQSRYDVTVLVTDGLLFATKDVTINLINVNEAPTIDAATQTAKAAVGSTDVSAIQVATDPEVEFGFPESATLTFSITGGADMALFDVDPANGQLSFKTAPSAEGELEVIIRASDEIGGSVDTTVTVTVSMSWAAFTELVYAYSASDGDATNGTAILAEELLSRPELQHVNVMESIIDRINSVINASTNLSDLSEEQLAEQLNAIILSESQYLTGAYNGDTNITQDLSQIDTHHAIDMSTMFSGATNFNQDISGWDVSQVETMLAMFAGATVFNQDISDWDVSSVTNMQTMFQSTAAFNQDIGEWNMSQVENTRNMFASASAFNQDISVWDMSSVKDLGNMFAIASSFDQNLGDWDLSSATIITGMFVNSGMSTDNLDLTLRGWSKVDLLAGETGLTNDLQLGILSNAITDFTAIEYLKDSYGWDFSSVNIDSNVVTGSSEAETIDKSAETNDLIIHTIGGADSVIGGSGNDYINAGGGDDVLTGNGGADIFAFSHADIMGHDQITDFNMSSGTYNVGEGDKLDLSQLLFGNPTSQNLGDYITFSYDETNPQHIILTIDRDTAVGADTYNNVIRLNDLSTDYRSLEEMIDDDLFIL